MDLNQLQNQRNFFDNLSKQLGFQTLDDFYSISLQTIRKFGGKTLLDKLYSSYLIIALKTINPQHKWLPWYFKHRISTEYWNSKENQREFMDWLGKELGFKEMKQWYNINLDDIHKNGDR